jgi:hypothetical protein
MSQKQVNVPSVTFQLDTLTWTDHARNRTIPIALYKPQAKKPKGVLPDDIEIKKFGIKIIKLPNTKHDEMDENGNDEQHKESQNYVLNFLKEKE